jgi:hypothetical protein
MTERVERKRERPPATDAGDPDFPALFSSAREFSNLRPLPCQDDVTRCCTIQADREFTHLRYSGVLERPPRYAQSGMHRGMHWQMHTVGSS